MGGWAPCARVACGRWRGCIAKFGYERYVCVNGRVKVTDRKWATIQTGKVVLLATSEVANLREILTWALGEGFNTQVVMVF